MCDNAWRKARERRTNQDVDCSFKEYADALAELLAPIDRSVYAIYRKSEYGKYGRLLEESYHILPRNIDPQKTFHLRDEKYSGGEYTITTLYC